MPSERELPKGWEWVLHKNPKSLVSASRVVAPGTKYVSWYEIRHYPHVDEWEWTASTRGNTVASGFHSTPYAAARAAERAVLDWLEGVRKEIEG